MRSNRRARSVTTRGEDKGDDVRLVVDVSAGDDDQVRGEVSTENCGTTVHFSGWLEFVRVLEAFTAESPGQPGGRQTRAVD
jgi:hypothetical protein